MRREDRWKHFVEWITQEPGCAWIPMTLMSILAALLSGVHGRVLILPLVSLNAVVYIVLTYIRPDRADFHQQARLVNRKQLAWLMLIWLIASILIAVAMLSYLARQPIWIQTQGVAEALASIMGSFVSMLFFLQEWLVLFFRREVPLVLVFPRMVWTLVMAVFVVGTFFIFMCPR